MTEELCIQKSLQTDRRSHGTSGWRIVLIIVKDSRRAFRLFLQKVFYPFQSFHRTSSRFPFDHPQTGWAESSRSMIQSFQDCNLIYEKDYEITSRHNINGISLSKQICVLTGDKEPRGLRVITRWWFTVSGTWNGLLFVKSNYKYLLSFSKVR